MRLRACTAGLIAIALLALPSLAPGASDEKDYSKNAATGDTVSARAEAEAALRKRSEALDRALQQGRLDPGYNTASDSVAQATRPADQGGFAWGDAAVGAAVVALALVGAAAGLLVVRRRIATGGAQPVRT